MEPTNKEETKNPVVPPKAPEKPVEAKKPAEPKKAPPKKPAKPAEVKSITWKLKDIILPKFWNRQKVGDISGLVASIKQQGVLQPIVVRRTDNSSKVELVAGRRRYAACLQLKMTEVPIVYIEALTEKDAFLASMSENLERENNTDYELAVAFDKCVTEYGMTNDEVAAFYRNKSPGYVSQRLAVLKQALPLQHALKAEKIPISIFRYFTKLDQDNHKSFYDKMVSEAIKGTSAQDIGDKIDFFLSKENNKKAAKAAKEGKKVESPAKRGGAAKKKKGPRFQITDYALPENKKLVCVQTTKVVLEGLEFATDKLRNTSAKRNAIYWQGYIAGLELAGGITALEKV